MKIVGKSIKHDETHEESPQSKEAPAFLTQTALPNLPYEINPSAPAGNNYTFEI